MIGDRLSTYEILAELGSGGMGTVYLGSCIEAAAGLAPGTRVALKVIHPHLLDEPGFFKRFLREAQVGQRVRHENVVRTYDCDATLVDGRQQNFMVMEFVEGQTLRALLDELTRVPEELCRHIGREVARGLAAIHAAGVIHRDLKPENVLITPDHVIKVMDLGVARLQDEAVRLSQAGSFVGSLEYAAPEQFRRADGEPDGRADLHALGVVLYELACGMHPYRDTDVSRVIRNILHETPRAVGAVNPQLSPFFEEVVGTLMAKAPAERLAAADLVATILQDGEDSTWWQQRARALRAETKQPLRRVRVPRETALHGRDDALATLQAGYDRASAGDGQVLLIEGEAGIGKTRLVDEFVGRLREAGEDVHFLFGGYPPGGAATAAGAFSDAYREQYGAEGLEAALAGHLDATPSLVPAFAAVLRGEASPAGAAPLARDSLQTVFVHATRGLAAERTTIVLIDDLHFAPEDGRALFSSLAMAAPGHRVLLVGTLRPGVADAWAASLERLEQVRRMALARLGPKDLTRLLRDAFRSEDLARQLAFQIGEKSDGNPFFAFEIIRGLREGQFIAQGPDGTWVTTGIIADIHVPSSIVDLVEARLADLADEERNLLEVAACSGYEFDPVLVGQVLGLAPVPALQLLGRIEKRHHLVRSVGRQLAFDHHQVQEALYAGTLEQLREHYHATIGEALEARAGAADRDPGTLDGALCLEMSRHFLAGRQGPRALRYVDAARQHLEDGFRHDEAAAFLDTVLEVPGLCEGVRRARLLLQKAQLLRTLGRRAPREAVLAEAEALAGDADDAELSTDVERALGVLRAEQGALEEAYAHYERSLALSRAAGDARGEGTTHMNLGTLLRASNRYEESEVHTRRAIELARESGNPQGEAGARVNLCNLLHEIGRIGEAQEQIEQAVALCRKHGPRRFEANAMLSMANLAEGDGRFDEALARYGDALTICRSIGDRQGQGIALQGIGGVHSLLGRSEEARGHLEQARRIARELGDPPAEAYAAGHLGTLLGREGRLQEALTTWQEAAELLRGLEQHANAALGDVRVADLLRLLGALERAKVVLEGALATLHDAGAVNHEAAALLLASLLAEELGDTALAWERARRALAMRRESGHVQGTADALLRVAELHAREADADRACAALDEAIPLLRTQQRPWELGSALALQACLTGGDGAEAEAVSAGAGPEGAAPELHHLLWRATGKREHLEAAKRLVDHRLEHAPAAYRSSMRERVRLHREIAAAWAALEDGNA